MPHKVFEPKGTIVRMFITWNHVTSSMVSAIQSLASCVTSGNRAMDWFVLGSTFLFHGRGVPAADTLIDIM